MFRIGIAIVVVALSWGTPAQAQLRQVNVLTLQAAKRAADAAEEMASVNNWVVAIAVVDHAGTLVVFRARDGVRPLSKDIALEKARTAARLQVPTKDLDDAMTEGRGSIATIPGLIALEGGVPIIVNGEVVGAVGVSGVSSNEDAQIAAAGAAAVLP